MKPPLSQPTRAERRHRYRPARSTLINAHVRRVLVYRYGRELPDDDAGRADLFVALQALAATGTGEPNVRLQMEAMAPWMKEPEATALMSRVYAKLLRYRADTLARALGVTDELRTELRIWTIGSTDVTAAERRARRNARKSARRRTNRRAAGAKSQDSSLSRTKPWAALGQSRATWYRQRRRETGLTPSILTTSSGVGDKTVSPRGGRGPAAPPTAAQVRSLRSRAAYQLGEISPDSASCDEGLLIGDGKDVRSRHHRCGTSAGYPLEASI